MKIATVASFAGIALAAVAVLATPATAYQINSFAGKANDPAKAQCFSESWGMVVHSNNSAACQTNGYTGNNWGPFWEVPLPSANQSGDTVNPYFYFNTAGSLPTCFAAGISGAGQLTAFTGNITAQVSPLKPNIEYVNLGTISTFTNNTVFAGCYMTYGNQIYEIDY